MQLALKDLLHRSPLVPAVFRQAPKHSLRSIFLCIHRSLAWERERALKNVQTNVGLARTRSRFRIAVLTQDLADLQGTLRGSSTLDVTADKFVQVEVGA